MCCPDQSTALIEKTDEVAWTTYLFEGVTTDSDGTNDQVEISF